MRSKVMGCMLMMVVVTPNHFRCQNLMCEHPIHHAYSPCKAQVPNVHQSCACYAICKVNQTDLRIRHCGKACGKM